MSWPFGVLKPHGYDLVMADPPWPTEMRSAKGEGKSHTRHYGSMSFEEIGAMPVGQLLGRDGVLFLWCTWPFVLHGGTPKLRYRDADAACSKVGEVIRRWGLRYVSGGAWFKRTLSDGPAMGPGYRVRTACEPFLLSITGNPTNSRRLRNAIESIVDNAVYGLRRQHSRKPEEAFAWCEQYLPGARRVELFSRASRPGWDSWGLEAGKFDPVVRLNAPPQAAGQAA